MDFGIYVLVAVIIFDIVFMFFVMRMVLTEPPHKHPKQHPLALEYAANGGEGNVAKAAVDAESAAETQAEADEASE